MLSASQQGDDLIYEVYEIKRPELAGELIMGISVVHPGKVGREFNMTKGHFHSVVETSEVYICLRGEGYMVMETSDGATAVEALAPGKVLYVTPGWAHRSVCTSRQEDLVTFFAYPANAGHDYGTIERDGFKKVVLDGPNGPEVVDNPRAQRLEASMNLKDCRLLVTPTSYGKNDSRLRSELESAVGQVIYNPTGKPLTSVEVAGLLPGIDGYIAGLDAIDAAALERADRLKVIARYGVGVDDVDLKAARERGIVVTNTPGANSVSVAELALGLMLALARQIPEAVEAVHAGQVAAVRGREPGGQDHRHPWTRCHRPPVGSPTDGL